VRPPEAAQSLPGSSDTVATSVRAPDQPVASVDAASQLPGDGRPVGPATSAQPGDVLPAPASPARAPANRSFLSELPFLVVVAFLLALLIKAFLVQAFYIPSGSMQQTLEIRDRVLVNKLVYDFRDIRRGEVVVFNGLDSFTQETVVAPPANGFQRVLRTVGGAIGLGVPGEKDFIKRVIGVPGDRVACCTDGKVTVQPQGAPEPVVLAEDYLFEDSAEAFCAAGLGDGSCPVGAEGILVPEGRLWVMGDHRSRSSDSRAHISDANSGTVPQDKVIGRAFVIVWPLDRARLLSVPDTFDGVVALGALPAAALSSTPYALGLIGALPVLALRRRLTGRRARAAAGPAALRG
jgi:signal peptidase I